MPQFMFVRSRGMLLEWRTHSGVYSIPIYIIARLHPNCNICLCRMPMQKGRASPLSPLTVGGQFNAPEDSSISSTLSGSAVISVPPQLISEL